MRTIGPINNGVLAYQSHSTRFILRNKKGLKGETFTDFY